jgi:hypothetical protein
MSWFLCIFFNLKIDINGICSLLNCRIYSLKIFSEHNKILDKCCFIINIINGIYLIESSIIKNYNIFLKQITKI